MAKIKITTDPTDGDWEVKVNSPKSITVMSHGFHSETKICDVRTIMLPTDVAEANAATISASKDMKKAIEFLIDSINDGSVKISGPDQVSAIFKLTNALYKAATHKTVK